MSGYGGEDVCRMGQHGMQPPSDEMGMRMHGVIPGHRYEMTDGASNEGGQPAEDSFKIFVGGIPPDAWEDAVHEYFTRFGRVLEVQVMKDKETGRSRGFGFVTMQKMPAANKERLFHPPSGMQHAINNKQISVRPYQSNGENAVLKRKVFVGGVPAEMSEETLKAYFSSFGPIERVDIMKDSIGRSRRFAFVLFENEDGCRSCVSYTGDHEAIRGDRRTRVEVREATARNNAHLERQRNNFGFGGFPSFGWGDFGPFMGSPRSPSFMGPRGALPGGFMPNFSGGYANGGFYSPTSFEHYGGAPFHPSMGGPGGFGPGRSQFPGGGERGDYRGPRSPNGRMMGMDRGGGAGGMYGGGGGGGDGWNGSRLGPHGYGGGRPGLRGLPPAFL